MDGRPNTVSTTTPLPSAHTASVTVLSKPRGPCYFFSSGYCARGENCTFLHTSSGVETLNQKSQVAPICEGLEINEKSSTPFKGNGSIVLDRSPPSVKGVSQNLPNVYVRAQSSPAINMEKTRVSGDSVTFFRAKEQADSLLSNRLRQEAMTNRQQEPESKNNQPHVLVRTHSQKNFLQKEDDRDKNGISKEVSPSVHDESNGSVYKEDEEYYKEDAEYYTEGLYEIGHGVLEQFHEFDYDSGMCEITRSDSSSQRERIRAGRDLRDHLIQRRLLQKEFIAVNGDSENFEEMDYLNLFEIQQNDHVLSEKRGENHKRPYQYGRGKYNREVKRVRRDFRLDYEGDTMQLGNLHRRYGHAKNKSKGQRGCNDKEVGTKAHVLTFVGPKSLAQIRAEREKVLDYGLENEECRARCKDTYSIKSQICCDLKK